MVGARLEDDGRADEAELLPNLIDKETLEGEVQPAAFVREQNEAGRGSGGLGHVINLRALRGGTARALQINGVQEAV